MNGFLLQLRPLSMLLALVAVVSTPVQAWMWGGPDRTGAAAGHWNITDEILNEPQFTDSFSPYAKRYLCARSSHLDQTFLGCLTLGGWYLHLFQINSQKPNHWEGRPEENEKRLNLYLTDAVRCANGGDVKRGLAALGDALHVGQDRGAHEHNHHTIKGTADNPKDNPLGWERAHKYTREVLKGFVDGLNEKAMEDMKK